MVKETGMWLDEDDFVRDGVRDAIEKDATEHMTAVTRSVA
jgi:hypothetical protein